MCGTKLGKPYLNLGEQPLANALRTPGDTSEEFKAPLAVCVCEECGLSQLTVVVDPEILYKGYRFRSGTSEAWRRHCADLAEECGEPLDALDIAANDGTMMAALDAKGWDVTGVDPSPCSDRYHVWEGLWGEEFSKRMMRTYDLVIAQNVLGHVDDPIDFLKGIKAVLAEDGQAVIEVPSVKNLIEGVAFDTIYHEHLSYWNGCGMERVASAAGLRLDRYDNLEVHGGSTRYWLSHGDGPKTITWSGNNKPYKVFGDIVSRRINQTAHLVDKASRRNLVAWGASAKGAVYLNTLHNKWCAVGLPRYVIDETAEKQGLLMPGVRIPIVAPPDDLSDVNVIWVLVWNWLEQVKEKARARGFKGKFLVTSPRPALVD